MATSSRKRILLAVDGSDQSLSTVQYVSGLASPKDTDFVMFYVGTGFPEVFWDMNRNPLYHSKKQNVMGWLAEQQLTIGEFKENAFNILENAGFKAENLTIKTQAQKTRVLKDIIEESYQGYHAIVAGRTGVSRLKDLLVGSMAFKLMENIRHIPTIIIAGQPAYRKILIALDESIESMRGVSCVGALAAATKPDITLFHSLEESSVRRLGTGRPDAADRPGAIGNEHDWRCYCENRFRPYMEEARIRLLEAGVADRQISQQFGSINVSSVQDIVETARSERFGTIVVGRRDAVSMTHRYFHGRFSEKLIRALENMAVWVVN